MTRPDRQQLLGLAVATVGLTALALMLLLLGGAAQYGLWLWLIVIGAVIWPLAVVGRALNYKGRRRRSN